MPEKLPPLERPEPAIFNPSSPEKKAAAKRSILERFGEKHLEHLPSEIVEMIKAVEYDKKPFEKSAIKKANEITNKLIEASGTTPFDIPERNIHVLPQTIFLQIRGENEIESVATTIHSLQGIILNAEKLIHPFDRISTTFHEMVHLKNFLNVEITSTESNIHRMGLEINATEKKEEESGDFTKFEGLAEAVVAEIEKHYFPELIAGIPDLKENLDFNNSVKGKKLKEKAAKENGIPVDEIMFIDETGKIYGTFCYYNQRKVLYYLVDRIYETHKNQFQSKDGVMKIFFATNFNGKLLPVARLIENVFGKGSFRFLSTMDTEDNSTALVMEYLKKHRQGKTVP
ncbi:MAG: hypothetical protein A3I24_03350 [Candidatus Harrisonbacteria bacterium RIFCSPLOWO2_02_FULL_41_13b]|uniref:Uncharacterized protein n=1 Tax=Candidatus Harrisonbacteria bacterium RIFCSPLOWO2_02_FULL_41_13b TaxID=1798409 RepID=A0A1G1ZRA1_9BACT|nr:MAG: hypothetical protein A3J53_02890 [Candidatus Harrisonbacteria bacterium RIFCSPHIGHO2_02_FULL_40_20]OGY66686.1 MAG: hypothetical protein A3I24_03350 [Candidatus Harrisonbacteria bacterium RIFCSPLOWO2_02_FULL_41_13b]